MRGDTLLHFHLYSLGYVQENSYLDDAEFSVYIKPVLILMNNKKLNKILQYVFILFSLIVIVYSVLFIVNQEVNIKYYFENSLPNGSNNSIPICQKDFFLEVILYAKVLLFYAIYGLFLSISCIKKSSYQDSK